LHGRAFNTAISNLPQRTGAGKAISKDDLRPQPSLGSNPNDVPVGDEKSFFC